MKLTELIKTLPGFDPYREAAGYHFDEVAAQDVIDFFPAMLTHVKGKLAGKPYELRPFEQALIANIFGWKDDEGNRRFREVLYYVPRKNSKTTLASGIGIYMTVADGEKGAENYQAAADAKQAGLAFQIVKGMVRQDDDLSDLIKPYARSIVYEDEDNFLQVLSSTADTKHGFNVHFAGIDELHVVPQELVTVLMTGTASREQPLTFFTTTADYVRESVCNDKYDYAGKVRDGVISDPQFLPVIYEATREDDWTSEEVWFKANPNLGYSFPVSYLVRECKRAQESPRYENEFKRLHLNIQTEQAERWLPMHHWNEGGDPNPVAWRKEMIAEFKAADCYGGLDLGSTADLTALVLLFEKDDFYYYLPWFWVPEDGVFRKDNKHKQLYEGWINQGFLKMTSGNVADYDYIREDINIICQPYGVMELAVDRVFQGAHLCTQLMEDRFEVVAFGQGHMSMAAPAKEFEERVLAHKVKHGSNPVLDWMASNCAVKTDPAGNIKPIKPDKNSSLKVDGIVSCVMATGIQMGNTLGSYGTGQKAQMWL